MTAPAFSLIIVNYNTRELLRLCLKSIAAHAPQSHVIVVDNGSRDDSVAMVRAEFPSVELVSLPQNIGFAPANNVGLERVQGEFAVLLNSDTELEDDGLVRCVCWMREHPELAAATPRLLGIDGQPQEPSYRFTSLAQELGVSLRQGRPKPQGDRDPKTWLAGTALVLRLSALEAIGGKLDANYFMYWEDADVSARLREAGWDLAVYPEAYVRHHGGASGGGSDTSRRPDLMAWYQYGRYRWFKRHRGAFETAGLWVMDWMNVARGLLKPLVRPSRRHEAAQARVMAACLIRALRGQRPPLPGTSQATSSQRAG